MQAGDPPAANGLYGAFLVNFNAEVPASDSNPVVPAFASVLGRLKDGEEPFAMAWDLQDEQAGCQLLTPRRSFCEPSCGGSAVCVEDGVCAPFPAVQSAGTVQVSGLLPSAFSMKYIAGNYQAPTLPYPPCAEGDVVRLSADGGSHAPFVLQSRCIAPLSFSGPLAIEPGRGLGLRWSLPGRADLARIQIKMDISHHGGTKGKIECDVADSGALELPASLVDALVALGVAGFPTISVRRMSTGSGPEPRVSLLISESVEREIEIPGLTSCLEDEDCPMGQRCQSDRQCR
jgi:hypothetical protein